MNILFTSDWQAQSNNLHKCKLAGKLVREICKKENVSVVINDGDLKEQYSPVDVRVANYWVREAKKYKKENIELHAVMGNHDRTGMFEEAGNWFPVLKAAGIKTYDEPTIVSLGGLRFFIAPYSSDIEGLIKTLDKFGNQADPQDSVLLFHQEVIGARFNRMVKITSGIPFDRLNVSRYLLCLGGHIHLPQEIRNTPNCLFIGSPFGMDWGEANQKKYFIILDTESKTWKRVEVNIPGFYDPSWPRFEENKPENWNGCHVRLHAPITKDVHDVHLYLKQYKEKYERKYKGAIIKVVPEFPEIKKQELLFDDGASDEQIIDTYLSKNCIEALEDSKEALIHYLKEKLKECGAVIRNNQTLELLEAEAVNVLSFKKLKIKYRYNGITVVTGENKDWPGRSNGSGKTSYLDIPSIAISGKTRKGQENNRWIRRNTKGHAFVRLKCKLADGRKFVIIRGRRPTRLQLILDHKDISVGIGSRGTQKTIETLTGLTWDTITSSMYIDPQETNTILSGKGSERKKLFSKLLNLERFDSARSLIKEDSDNNKKRLEKSKDDLLILEKKLEEAKETLENLGDDKEFRKVKVRVNKLRERLREFKIASKRHEQKFRKLKGRIETFYKRSNEDEQRFEEKVEKYQKSLGNIEASISRLGRLGSSCPTCGSSIDPDACKRQKTALLKQLPDVENRIRKWQSAIKKINSDREELEDKIEEAKSKFQDKIQSTRTIEIELRSAKQTFAELKKTDTIRRKHKRKVRKLTRSIKITNKCIKEYTKDTTFYKFCLDVFSKDGLPAYLVQQICPRLNKATEEASKIISDEEIKIRFVLNEQEVDAQITNAHGGELIADQSRGEGKIASLIASFALREVINPCNVLALDEPGDGLDAANIKVFAEALRRIASRYGHVLVTSHNPGILGALSSERRVRIVKRNGISKVISTNDIF